MKKILFALLMLPAIVFAQSYPSPTFQNVTVLGTLSAPAPTFSTPLAVSSGGTGAATASGTSLDNITGFSGTGFLTRTGAGTYAFQALTNGITYGNLAQAGANTLLGNVTGATANVAAVSVTGCNGAAQALQYTSGSGFGCNSGIATSGANANITSLSGLTTPLSVGQGGIGAATLAQYNILAGNGTSALAAIGPGTSGYVLTSNGASSYPSFQALSVPSTSVNYTASGTSPVTRTASSRFGDDVHLEDYCSATTLNTTNGDITSCLQNAINALPASGGRCVTLPATPSAAGSWDISSTINIGNGTAGAASSVNGVCIRGSGSGGLYGSYGTTLTWSGTSGGTMFSVNGPINNYELSNVNLNGNNSAGTILLQNSVRFSDLHNLYISGFTNKGIDTEGLSTTGDLNFMLDWSKLYVTTSQTNAIAVNFDGVIANSTDTWLTTVRNSRFESLGTGGIALRLAYSDNILFDQIHLVTGQSGGSKVGITGTISSGTNSITSVSSTTGLAVGMYITDSDANGIGTDIPAGTKITSIVGSTLGISKNATGSSAGYGLQVYSKCGLLLDASSTVSGNPFPTGHQFDKTATDNVCLMYDSTHPMGIQTVYGFGTTDNEAIPSSPYYMGVTDKGVSFNGFGGPNASGFTPTMTFNGGTQGSGNTVIGSYGLEGGYADVTFNVSMGASGVTTPGSSVSLSLPSGITPSASGACSGVNSAGPLALAALVTNGANTITVWTYSGGFPVGNGGNMQIECRYPY